MRTLTKLALSGFAVLGTGSILAAQSFTRLISVNDTISSVVVDSILQVQVNNSGDWAAMIGFGFAGGTNGLVVKHATNNKTLVFKEGDSLPSSLCIGQIGAFEMNNSGDIVVSIQMRSNGCSLALANDIDDALFFLPAGATSPAALVQVVREGDTSPLPGMPVYVHIPTFRFGDDNTVLVAGVFPGNTAVTGLVGIALNPSGAPIGATSLIKNLVTALGTAPPPPPIVPDYVVGSFPAAREQLAWKWTSPANPLFVTSLDDGGGTANNPLAVYLDSGALGSPISNQIARMGDTPPSGGSGWQDFNGLSINQCGEIAYVGQVGTGSPVFHLVRRLSPSSVQDIARTGPNALTASSLLFGSSLLPLGFMDTNILLCEGACSGSGPGEIIWTGASTTATGAVTAIFANELPLVVENVTSDGAAIFTGVAYGAAFSMDASDDGKRVIFTGSSGGAIRAYMLDRVITGSAFCFGDGNDTTHTTTCPCGNNGALNSGCAHSFSANGARLAASGSSISDTAVLESNNTPVTSFTLFLQHVALGDSVFHDGILCASGTLIRLRGRAAVGGQAFFPNASLDTVTLSQRGQVTPGSGARRYYSAWYRNASSTFCPPATANVSNGWLIDW